MVIVWMMLGAAVAWFTMALTGTNVRVDMEEGIMRLIEDLKKSAAKRKETGQRHFTEELVIIRLRDILRKKG